VPCKGIAQPSSLERNTRSHLTVQAIARISRLRRRRNSGADPVCLQGRTSSTAVPIKKVSDHDHYKDESDRTQPPTGTQPPVNAPTTAKQQQENYQNDEQIHH
jgi:hypothetical protein